MNQNQKLYDLLMNWHQNKKDWCESSHDTVNEIINVVKKWIPENKNEVLYSDKCYNEALEDLRNSLR